MKGIGVSCEWTQPGRLAWRRVYDVLWILVWRDLRLRYRNSVLGVTWAVLLPLAQAAVLVFVFGVVLPLGIDAYPAFVLVALFPWTWLSTSVASATSAYLDNRDLVRHPGFAPPLLIAAVTLSNLLLYLAALPVVVAVCLFYGTLTGAALAALPLLIVVQGALQIAVGVMTATAHVFFRDTAYVVGLALLLLFYMTPVFYRVPETTPYAWIYAYNPLAALITGYRAVFFEGAFPSAASLLVVAGVSAVLAVGAAFVWRRYRDEVLDRV